MTCLFDNINARDLNLDLRFKSLNKYYWHVYLIIFYFILSLFVDQYVYFLLKKFNFYLFFHSKTFLVIIFKYLCLCQVYKSYF